MNTPLVTLFLTSYDEFKVRLKRRLGSDDLACDVLQETYLRVDRMQATHALHKPNAYLYRMALNIACVLLITGVWIEKGMGLIVPAFIPSPLGEVVEYKPTLNESLVSLGIWAFGLLVYTILVRVTIPVLSGRLTFDRPYGAPPAAPPDSHAALETH